MPRPWQGLAPATALVRLIHPYPICVVVLVSIALLVVLRGSVPNLSFLLRATLVVLTSQVTVGALNDYVDRETDRRWQPSKPIPSGLVDPAVALGIAFLAAAVCLPLAVTFGAASVALTVVGTGAGIAYDLWLKPTVAGVAAYIVGFLTLLTWIVVLAGRFALPVVLVYSAGALLIVAGYLANALPDIETDRAQAHTSLPVCLGASGSFAVMLLFFLCTLFGGVAAAAANHSLPGLWLVAGSACLGAAATVVARRGGLSRSSRRTVFRLMAAAIVLLATGCTLAVLAPR